MADQPRDRQGCFESDEAYAARMAQPSTPAPSGAPPLDVETVLAQVLSGHQWWKSFPGQCACGWRTDKHEVTTEADHRAHVASALAAALRGAGLPEPSSVTVTEWGTQRRTDNEPHVVSPNTEAVAKGLRETYGDRTFTRQRTTYPDRVTDWQEATP